MAAPNPRPVLLGHLRRLKELNYVAGRVHAEDLFATPLLHDVVSEFHTLVLEPRDEGFQIVDTEDEPGPASRARRRAIWHRPGR